MATKKPQIEIYDTTLRDGSQSEGISYSVQDKIRISEQLDWLGVHYIEAGWPGSNPKDMAFFKAVKKMKFKNAEITAFGSTRRAGTEASRDPNLAELVKAGAPVVTIFGKSWDLHVKSVFHTNLDENLKMIDDSVRFLKKKTGRVMYDAEHFFDGYKDNAEYALRTCRAALEAGAEIIILCDTNGGTVPSEVGRITRETAKALGAPLGIHTHNDCSMAVANAVSAVEAGVVQVQGTVNGCGERCGNPDLISLIPTLQLKLGFSCIPEKNLQRLTKVSRFIGEVANMVLLDNQPYVGKSAFAHKGGIHINAVLKNSKTYEHIAPETVGNTRRFLTSELMGKSHLLLRAKGLKFNLTKDNPKTAQIMRKLQALEKEGYQFEAAEASFDLLLYKSLGKVKKYFELLDFRVHVIQEKKELLSEASIRVKVRGTVEHSAARGDGPVNALDNALRKALLPFYPALSKMHLSDFKVRVLDQKAGTAAKVRVFIESRDESGVWTTVGISENIIEASWIALVDSVEYKLLNDELKSK